MNEISKVSYFVVDKFKSNPLVNTISFEKTVEMDFNKENIYPLVNIDVVFANPEGENTVVKYILTVVQERDVDNEHNNDKLFGSNLIDNLNETNQILSKYIKEVSYQHNQYDIDVNAVTNINFLKNFRGAVDGSQVEIELLITNDISAC